MFDTAQKVSIIIPVYNAQEYIQKCLNSVLNQTYENIEIIVVDDGSSDNSADIIKQIAKEDDRLLFIDKVNEGVSRARNCGLNMASGEYITFVDADDWVEDDFISSSIEYIEKYKLDYILGGTIKRFLDRDEILAVDSKAKIYLYSGVKTNYLLYKVLGYETGEALELNQCFTSGVVCKVFKKTIIGDTRFDENLVLGEDSVFNIQVMGKAQVVGVVPNLWYNYRMHHQSAVGKIRPNIYDETNKLIFALDELTYDNIRLNQYCICRALRQFNWMMVVYPFHKDSKMSLVDQYRFIYNSLHDSLWVKMFGNFRAKALPTNKNYKLMAVMCKYKMSGGLMIMLKLNNWFKS